MLASLFVAALSTVVQGTAVQTVVAARRDEPAQARKAATSDSIRASRSARRAQETFEFVRRQYLPREDGVGSHHCDVRIGRWCIWNDETNHRKPPPESPHVTQARERLLGVLDTVGAHFPGDEWVAAQQVRYLIEAKRFGDAVRIGKAPDNDVVLDHPTVSRNHLVLKRQGGNYSLMQRCRRDDNSQYDTGFFAITDGPHWVLVEWRRATDGGSADGVCALTVDGNTLATLSDVQNNASTVGSVRLGTMSVKPGANGTPFFDEFVSKRTGDIPPLP